MCLITWHGLGEGAEIWMPKNHGYHQSVEIKFCMSHKSMPHAKFESGSFSSCGDMTPQNFCLKKRMSHQSGYLPPENGFNFLKNEFSCPESFFSTQN